MAKKKVLEEEINDEEEVEPWPEDEDEEDEEDEDWDDDDDSDEEDDEESGVDDGDGIEEDEERLSREEFDEQVLTPKGIRPMSQRGIELWEEYNNQF